MLVRSDNQIEFRGWNLLRLCRTRGATYNKSFNLAERRLRVRSSLTCAGFSLLEMTVSIALLLVISGAILSTISYYQQTYSRTAAQSDIYENVRGAAELMSQEIGQAGLVSLPSPSPTLSAAVTNSATAQTVNVSSTTSMFVGEQLLVDAGTKEELVTPTGVTSTAITAIFGKSHASGAGVNVLGVIPSGIVPPGATDGSTSVVEPGVSVLNLVGDINADGSLLYVRYTCDTSTTPGKLSRSVTIVTPGVNTINSSQTLLSTLIPNPGGTPCFQYSTNTITIGATTYTFVTNVGLTLSVQSLAVDLGTQQYLTMTKSFLDLSPRNVLTGFEAANAGDSAWLQAQPPNVSAY
jgi:prepilin-type N-terminal cleavage/methylation domain-containing protein